MYTIMLTECLTHCEVICIITEGRFLRPFGSKRAEPERFHYIPSADGDRLSALFSVKAWKIGKLIVDTRGLEPL